MINIENTSDINFGFRILRNIPVFLTVFISFIAGMFCAIPFVLAFKLRKKDKPPKKKGKEGNPGKPGGNMNTNSGQYGID